MTYKPDPDALLQSAGELLARNAQGAIAAYKKAANLFMERGDYFKVFETCDVLARVYKENGHIGEMIAVLNEFALKMEDFQINDVAAKFHERAGNLCYELQDFTTASEHYEKAGDQYELMHRMDGDEDLRMLSGVLLMKSGESLYKRPNQKDKAEDLLIRGIFRYCGVKDTLRDMERDLFSALKAGSMEHAARVAGSLAGLMKEVIEKMEVVRTFDIERLANSVKSRLLHYKAEYLFVEYLVARRFPDHDKTTLAARTLDKITEGIDILHGIMKVEHDKEDVERYCFDALLRGILLALEGEEIIDKPPEDGLDATVKEAIQQHSFTILLGKIKRFGLQMVKDDVSAANLGKFSQAKATIVKLVFDAPA